MTNIERAEFTQWLYLEFRRLSRYNGEKHSCCMPSHLVPVRPPAQPQAMSLPPCLCSPDTEAGQARRFAHARELIERAAA